MIHNITTGDKDSFVANTQPLVVVAVGQQNRVAVGSGIDSHLNLGIVSGDVNRRSCGQSGEHEQELNEQHTKRNRTHGKPPKSVEVSTMPAGQSSKYTRKIRNSD
jgi:hypothetical protein